MDVKEGHPGAIFHWFFDSGQGTDYLAQFLIILYGSSPLMAALVKKCIEKQSEFNEALGSEILFLFFDTELPPLSQTEAGGLIEKHLLKEGPAKFLFSGHGEAHAMPPSLIEIGRERFRSERPGSQHFEEVAKAVAEAHKKAIPFFQNAFGLEPGINALIFAHRTQRSLKLYDLGHKVLLEPDDLLRMMVSMRPVARHSRVCD